MMVTTRGLPSDEHWQVRFLVKRVSVCSLCINRLNNGVSTVHTRVLLLRGARQWPGHQPIVKKKWTYTQQVLRTQGELETVESTKMEGAWKVSSWKPNRVKAIMAED